MFTFKDARKLFQIDRPKKVRMRDYDPGWHATEELEALTKGELKARAAEYLENNRKELASAQERLYATDTYSVLGPWLVTRDEIADPGELDLWLQVNGADRQRTNTRHLIYGVPRLIEYASAQYTLYPGDIIMTGTPEGVGPVVPGDVIEAGIGGIGTLRVVVGGGQNKR